MFRVIDRREKGLEMCREKLAMFGDGEFPNEKANQRGNFNETRNNLGNILECDLRD
jgi:hypothetical protein